MLLTISSLIPADVTGPHGRQSRPVGWLSFLEEGEAMDWADIISAIKEAWLTKDLLDNCELCCYEWRSWGETVEKID